MEEKAKQLGASTRFSATDVAEGFQYMALAGWDANTSLSAIDGVLQLAASAEMDLGAASDMVTDYLAAFGMEASRAGEMADMLAYAQANSNTSAVQLGDAYGNCAAGLHAAGQEMDTVTALLEGMANNGLKGSEAGTALNAVMAQITQKMSDGAIQIGETTVAVQDQNGNFRDLIDIMADVEGATDGMGSAEKSAALAAVFNRTSLAGVNQILNEGTDKIRGYRDELDKSAGAAEDMAGVMQDNLQGDLTEMNSALEGLGIAAYGAFGDKLRDGVQLATDVISGLTDAISRTNTPLQDFIQSVDDGNRRVKESLESAQGAFSSAETDAAKLEVYKQALLDVADATETTEFQKFQISQIVEELGGEIPELAAAWDEETGKLNLNAEAIENLMSTYESAAMQQAYMDALIESEKALADAKIQRMMADSAVAEIDQQLVDIGEEEKRVLTDGLSATIEYNDAVGDLRDSRYDALVVQTDALAQEEKAQALVDKTKKAYEEYAKELPECADGVKNVADAEEEATKETENLAAKIDEIDPEAFKRLQEEAAKTEESIRTAMQGAVSAFNEFNGGAEVTKDEIIKNLDSQISGLENWSSNMQRLAQEAGSGMSQELYDYLAEMGPQSANLVQTLVDTLESDTGSFEEISQKWSEALKLSDNADAIASATSTAKAVVDAYTGGIEEGTPTAQNAMKAMGETAVEILDTTKAPMTAKGMEGVQAFANGTTAGTSTATSAAAGVASAAASSATDYSGFYSSGSQSAAGLAAGIRAGRSGAVSAAVEIMKAAVAAAKHEADIHSPSKKWEKEVGQQLAKGAAKGLKDGTPDVVKSAKEMISIVNKSAKKMGDKAFTADFFGVSAWTTEGYRKNKKKVKKDVQTYYSDIYDSAKSYMDKVQTLYDVSDKAELKYWKKVQKNLKKGTEAWYDAQKQINSLKESIQSAKEDKRQTRANVQDDLLDNYKVYYETTNKAEMEYWDKARKQFKKGTQERIDADKKYFEARKDYLEELTDLNTNYKEESKEINDDLAKQTKDLTDELTEDNNRLKDALKKQTEQLTTDRDKEIEKMNADLLKQTERLNDDLERQTTRLNDDLAKQGDRRALPGEGRPLPLRRGAGRGAHPRKRGGAERRSAEADRQAEEGT